MAAQSRMSLRNIEYNPTPFQAVAFTPQSSDVNLLANSLAKQEERENRAVQSLAEANKVFATMRSQLHQDKKTMDRFNSWQRGYTDRLYQLRNLDPDRAYKEATLLGTEVVNDAEMQGRIRNNTDFKSWKKDLNDNKNINQVTKDRLLEQENNRFNSELEYDNLGNITGTKEWKAKENAVNNVSRLDLAAFTTKIVAPKETSNSRENTTGHTNADGSSNLKGGSSTTTRKVLSPERLKNVFNEVFKEFPGAEASLMQDYKDDVWRLEKINEELLNSTPENAIQLEDEKRRIRERLFTDGGAGRQRTPTEYMADAMNIVLDNAAYDYVTTNTSSKNITQDAPEKTSATGNSDITITGWPNGYNGGDNLYSMRSVGTVMDNNTGTGYVAGQEVNNAITGIQFVLNNLALGATYENNGITYVKTANGIQQVNK